MKIQANEEQTWGFQSITAPGNYLLTFDEEGIRIREDEVTESVALLLPTTVTGGDNPEQEGARFTIFLLIKSKKGDDSDIGWNRLQHILTITGLAPYFEEKFKDVPDDVNPLLNPSLRERIVKHLIYKLGGKSIKAKIVMNKIKTVDAEGNEIVREVPNIEKTWSAYSKSKNTVPSEDSETKHIDSQPITGPTNVITF